MAENIVKRGEVWYYREQRKNKGILRSLKTRDRREAKRLASQMKEKLDRGDLAVRVKQEYPTVGDLYDLYTLKAKEGKIRATSETARSNFRSLCLVLRHSIEKQPENVTEEEIKKIKLGAITTKVSEEFQTYEIGKGRSARSINSTWRQAVSMFSAQMLAYYAVEKYEMPADFLAFLKAPRLKAKPIEKFNPMSREEIDALLEATKDLAVSGKPNAVEMTKIIYMAYYLGMRAKEILLAKKRHFEVRGKVARLRIDTVKGGNPRTITVSERLRDLLYNKLAKPDEFIIANDRNSTARYNLVYRHTGAFLRGFLETDEDKQYAEEHGMASPRKLLHHLRKQAGAQLVTRHGLYHAQEFLGHKNPTVTNMYYSALLQELHSLDE
jgi:integrase